MLRNFLSVLVLFCTVSQVNAGSVISVTGVGEVQAEPDEGYITVGVYSHESQAKDAVRANAVKMSSLMAALKKQNIVGKNIQTVDFSLNVGWKNKIDNGNSQQIPDGYIANNIIRITVCELENFGNVLDVISDSVDNVSQISFGSSKSKELLEQSRAKAVQDAKQKAQTITDSMGIKLGNVLRIVESNSYSDAMSSYSDVHRGSSTTISTGSLSFKVQISFEWALDF